MTVAELKTAMRITHSFLDADIANNINTCLLDLERAGINTDDDSSENQLVSKAIELYAKWQYDFEGKGDRYEEAYKNMVNALALCEEYNNV